MDASAYFRTGLCILVAMAMSPQARCETLLQLNDRNDPTGVNAAATEDVDRLAWNTMLTVPATGNSFSYEFDVNTGLPRKTSSSLGPLFTSRASTIGNSRVSLSASVSYFEFDETDGIDLQNGEIQTPFPTPFGTGLATTRARPRSLVTQLSATYGVTSDVDLSIAVPILSNDTHLDSSISVGGQFLGSSLASANGTAIADVMLRAKWLFLKREHFLVGTELGLWLPTGDSDNYIGLEEFRFEPWMIASTRNLPINFHVNLGASVGETDKLRNEFRYKIGADWEAIKRVTLSAEVLGRHIVDNDRVLPTSTIFGVTGRANSHYNDGIAGLKWNPFADVVLFGSAIVALDDTGYRDNLTGILGIEVGF